MAKIDHKGKWEDPIISEPSQMVSDKKVEGDDSDRHPDDTDPEGVESEVDDLLWFQPVDTPFDTQGAGINNTQGQRPVIIKEGEDKQPTNIAAKMLRFHHQFGHISFHKLQLMAKQEVIPKRLEKVLIPLCLECLYSKSIKSQWRHRTAKNQDQTIQQPTNPGHLVSVDQLVSPNPGLISNMTGILKTKCCKYATVYADQVSRLNFAYLQNTVTAN